MLCQIRSNLQRSLDALKRRDDRDCRMTSVHLRQQKGGTLHLCLGLLLDRPPCVQIKANLLLCTCHPLLLCFTASGDKRRLKVLRPTLAVTPLPTVFRSSWCLAEAE